jgi:hypothetical protein
MINSAGTKTPTGQMFPNTTKTPHNTISTTCEQTCEQPYPHPLWKTLPTPCEQTCGQPVDNQQTYPQIHTFIHTLWKRKSAAPPEKVDSTIPFHHR